MNTESRLIKLYRTRTFSEKMSDTFDFVRENWRPLIKYITYLLLPVALIETFLGDNFMTGNIRFANIIGKNDITEMMPWLSSLIGMVLFTYVGFILLNALVYTMMQQYEQRQGLQGVTFADLKPGILRMTARQMILFAISIVLIVVFFIFFALMITISPFMIFPVILVAILVYPLLILVTPIYLFEDRGIISTYAKSVRLGWKTWAGIVAVTIVLYTIAIILQTVISMPAYIMMGIKEVLTAKGDGAGFVSSFGYSAVQYLLGVIASFCGSCLLSFVTIGTAYQYGHACDKVDGVTVDRDIENFESLN